MIKKALLLIGTLCTVATASFAQGCITDIINNKLRQEHPEIAVFDAQLERDIAASIQNMKVQGLMRGTANDTDTSFLDIPVVVHIVHDFGAEYISDDKVYTMMAELNAVYSKKNLSELTNVIPTFVPYIGNMHLRFHLAGKDPNGNPTHGITRTRSYLTVGGDNQAKLDYWRNDSYLNIWFIKVIGQAAQTGIVAAYSMYPGSAQFDPYHDGLIANYQFIVGNGGGNNTVPHEIGHYFNLQHPWGNTNNPGVACGDDGVDDTPPTKGHFSTCDVYDVTCAVGYTKNGINYPDTTNVQNIMDYSSCELMFTTGQAQRTRAALRSSVAARNNLYSPANLAATGALLPRPSLPPVADFSNTRYFGCANTNVFTFINRSWNDTVTGVNWTFSNGSSQATSTSTGSVASLSFTDPGWVTVGLTATSAGGSNTVTKQAVYVADPVAVNPSGYLGEFAPGTDAGKYPAFNYYNTPRKWALATNAGVYDQYSMKYTNIDPRSTPQEKASGMPLGDYSDFFTPGFDLSGSQFSTVANLSFFTAGAYRSASQNDLLEITYSIDCGTSWRKLDSIKADSIATVPVSSSDFTPSNAGQWRLHNTVLPAAAKVAKVFFRFRYRPGVDGNQMGSGNNFYIDRIVLSPNFAGIDEHELAENGIALAPNPTSGNAYVILSAANTGTAKIRVTDITGKLVYSTAQIISGTTKIEIPSSVLTVKGMYLVQVLTDSKPYTRKLIVY